MGPSVLTVSWQLPLSPYVHSPLSLVSICRKAEKKLNGIHLPIESMPIISLVDGYRFRPEGKLERNRVTLEHQRDSLENATWKRNIWSYKVANFTNLLCRSKRHKRFVHLGKVEVFLKFFRKLQKNWRNIIDFLHFLFMFRTRLHCKALKKFLRKWKHSGRTTAGADVWNEWDAVNAVSTTNTSITPPEVANLQPPHILRGRTQMFHRGNGKLGAYATKRVTAGAHLWIPWLYECKMSRR